MFSDSFAGPMFALMNSIKKIYQPETNVFDAYKTLNLVEKVIISHESKKCIEL